MKLTHKSIYGRKNELHSKEEILNYIVYLEILLERFDLKWSSAYLFLTETQARKYCKLAEGVNFEGLKKLCDTLRPHDRVKRQVIINKLVKK